MILPKALQEKRPKSCGIFLQKPPLGAVRPGRGGRDLRVRMVVVQEDGLAVGIRGGDGGASLRVVSPELSISIPP